MLNGLRDCQVVALEDLASYLEDLGVREIDIKPVQPLLRYLHYNNGNDLYYFINEAAEPYCGTITIPSTGSCYVYNAWDNRREKVITLQNNGKTELTATIEPRKSLILIFDEDNEGLLEPVMGQGEYLDLKEGWKRSTCRAIHYPDFDDHKPVILPDRLEQEQPDFGGFIRYECDLDLPAVGQAVLEITGETEGVEVFVNGISAGIQVVPVYRFAITEWLREGKNRLVIEVATTLERVIPATSRIPGRVIPEPVNQCGIQGTVKLWISVN